ncbi:bifunctional folylpolyglutamate synthase/dihydrofolate synthase [Desulfatibacillum aliphaticivorans]|uniref:bifunctional folylpolyglutamate synthase/dihydrofolate synthase n=1 Tax=Desulfatibacillum aliphaticivorans TaxID=218208 RepID=UPI0003F9B25E|nr:folylpolyglutamate synthase/dihydrofolate synthase family protein [Desulfatibacillum aliphaticivorans]
MTDINAFNQAMEELFSLGRFGIKLGLETISAMLKGIGDPHLRIQCIHIAGTNGKGSVAQNTASILQAAGYKVGVYTSPHLVHINERFTVNGRPISDDEVLEAYQAVKSVSGLERHATFFEYTTAMALYAFDKAGVDYAVMETGMGGRLDATNVLKPELCIITNISVEHEMYLGNTIAQIAYEKAGIIKPGVPVVTGVRQPDAIKAVEKAAAENEAPLYRMGKDFKTRRLQGGGFNFYGQDHAWKGLQCRLKGEYQIPNASLALAGCQALTKRGAKITEEQAKAGLEQVKWPGRLETIQKSPMVILDGAHNLAAMKVLTKYLAETFADRDVTVITGFLDDKPYKKMLPMLEALAAKIIITRPKIGRAVETKELTPLIRNKKDRFVEKPSVEEAVKYALENARDTDVIVVAGSLYIVGEARQTLQDMGLIQDESFSSLSPRNLGPG